MYLCRKLLIVNIILIAITLKLVNGQPYRIPRPTVTALSPRGFRVSIPGKSQSLDVSWGKPF